MLRTVVLGDVQSFHLVFEKTSPNELSVSLPTISELKKLPILIKAPQLKLGLISCLKSREQFFKILLLYKYIAVIIPIAAP